MVQIALRSPGAPVRFVFDGQSLGNYPAAPLNYPSRVMSGRGVPWVNKAVDGIGWNTLAATVGSRKLYEQATNHSGATVLVGCGGTANINSVQTAQTIYNVESLYASDAVAAGFDYVIWTTITQASSFDAGEETKRIDHNVLVIADADNAFDAVCDFAGVAELDDRTDTTYYQGGLVHWTAAGAQAAADAMSPYIDAAITALTP